MLRHQTIPDPGETGIAANRYVFGQDRLAAGRLRLLHRVIGPASRSLLEELRSRGPFETALDLGCGPGCTTGLLAELLRPRRLVGIDLSETFLRFGRRQVPEAEFVAHDLRMAPYPGAPAALLYARYVLGHLGDLEQWFRVWADQLAPGGVLVVEENEWIRVPQVAFARYLELAQQVMAAERADLYPGSRLAEIGERSGLRPLVSRVSSVSPESATAARMFRLNLASWSRRASARPHAGELAELTRELRQLETSSARDEITWGLRQLAVARPEAPGRRRWQTDPDPGSP